jgi:hypothetical protein
MDPSTSRCHQRQPFSTACSNSLRAGVDDAVPEHPVKSISWKTNESPRACPQRQSLDAVTRHQDSDPQRQYPISVHSDSLTALSAATAPQRCQRDINIMIHSDVSQRCPQRHPTTIRCVSLSALSAATVYLRRSSALLPRGCRHVLQYVVSCRSSALVPYRWAQSSALVPSQWVWSGNSDQSGQHATSRSHTTSISSR